MPLKVFFTLNLLLFAQLIFAQKQWTRGHVLDSLTGAPVEGAWVYDSITASGKVSDKLGQFQLANLQKVAIFTISHIGYQTLRAELHPADFEGKTDIEFRILPLKVKLDEIKILASFAEGNRVPLPVSNLSASRIEAKLGNRDFPEAMRMVPGLYATPDGGGSGDSKVSLRGFQQDNVALLLNGVPVSSMENGLVYWSNWSGLADATRAVQVQRGLGASNVAMNSVGGTLNLITFEAGETRGGYLRTGISDYGNFKTTLLLSSGRSKQGLSALFVGSRLNGPGYVDGTFVDSWSYFMNLAWQPGGKHRLVLVLMGSPDKHGQRNYPMTMADHEKYGNRYNANWGYKDGALLNLSTNFYHKPQLSLSHYYHINNKTLLISSLYFSPGWGGGQYAEAYNYGTPVWDFRKNNQVDFDTIVLLNQLNPDTATLANGQLATAYSKRILTHYRSDHYWAGALASLRRETGKHSQLLAGIHWRKFKSHLYEQIDDLLGGQYWIEQYAWSAAGIAGRGQIKGEGDIVNVNNYSLLDYGNLFAQWQYTYGPWSFFVSSTLSGTQYQREDPYNYPSDQMSKAVFCGGYDAKAGISYKASSHGTWYLNAGHFSKEPYYKYVFVNFSNQVAKGLHNEGVSALEGGYVFSSAKASVRINGYVTSWRNKSMLTYENIQLADSSLTRALVKGMDALHMGVETEIDYNPHPCWKLSAMVSLANWKWLNDVHAQISDDQHVLLDTMIYAKGLFVGDSPQTQMGAGFDYESPKWFYAGGEYVWNDRLYADYDPANRTNAADRSQPYRLPSYGILDLWIGAHLKAGGNPVKLQINGQNILDKVTLVRGIDGPGHKAESVSGFWSMGRTFQFSLKINF